MSHSQGWRCFTGGFYPQRGLGFGEVCSAATPGLGAWEDKLLHLTESEQGGFSAATKLKGVLYLAAGTSHQLYVALPLASYQRLSTQQLGLQGNSLASPHPCSGLTTTLRVMRLQSWDSDPAQPVWDCKAQPCSLHSAPFPFIPPAQCLPLRHAHLQPRPLLAVGAWPLATISTPQPSYKQL